MAEEMHVERLAEGRHSHVGGEAHIGIPIYPPNVGRRSGMQVLAIGYGRMGVYAPTDDADGALKLQQEYRLTPDGYRIVIDPIPQLEAGE